ncbi:MAG: 3-deoxy-D-manno-octulosonic acid kinase [Gammaproteobacteria bacterium]
MRLERTGVPGGFILADARLAPASEWFDPGYWKAHGAGEPLGHGRGVTVNAGPDGRWVLRHYHRGGLPARFIRDSYLWLGEPCSRPVRELRLLAELVKRGASVPRPVAARVMKSGPLYNGDLLTERIADARTFGECAHALATEDWMRIGETIRHFHDVGGWHADLNAHNILIAPSGVSIIDLDRGKLLQPGVPAQARNLARLERSLAKLGLLPEAESGWRALLSAYWNFRSAE